MILEKIMQLPLIDSHCHLFMTEPNEVDFSKTLSMSLHDVPVYQTREVLNYKRWQRLLKQFTGSESEIPNTKQAVEASGCKTYHEYAVKLFTDVNIERLVIDLGYEPARVDLPEFEKFLPSKISYVYRIETFLDKAWKERPDFDKLIADFEAVLRENLGKDNFVGIKTIIGYRTGLEVEWLDKAQARARYNKGDEKGFRDYCLRVASDITAEFGKVLKIHTGVGESNLDVLKNNPLLLKKFIEHYQQPNGLKILLLHGGYPYTFEAGYMTGTFPNIWLELSVIGLWGCLDTQRDLLKLMAYAPLNKLVHGSDGYIVPELHWFGAKSMKIEFCQLLESLIARGFIDTDQAMDIAKNVFSENSKLLYKFI